MNWDELRQEFSVTQKWVFFDHAAVAPLSARAQCAMRDWVDDVGENGIVVAWKWIQRMEQVRNLLAQLINADREEIAFIKNTTEGISYVAEGFPWSEGDNVVTAAEEYPTNVYPWMNLASRGVETRLVPSRGSRVNVDDLLAHVDDSTRIVSLSFVEYASGFRNDLDKIGEACRERGVLFFVDAIQGLGMLPLDVKQTPIDALSADGHKWLLGPEGAGLFWIRRELIEKLHPIGVGWNSVVDAWDFNQLNFQLKADATRWEGGTWNLAGIHGLGASVELLLELGMDKVSKQVLRLTDHLCWQAKRIGVDVFSSREDQDRSAIVSLYVPNVEPKEMVKRCREAGIIVNHRAGRIRVSPHCYNTEEEIDGLIDVIKHENG